MQALNLPAICWNFVDESLIFNQQIIRKADEKLMVNAKITAVLTKTGRPISPAILVEKFEEVGIVMEEI